MSEENMQVQSALSADDNKYYGMRYDMVFKKAFVENNDLLKRFISDMLDIPFEDIGEVVVSNPELVPDDVDGKFSRMDIKAHIRNAVVNIEMTISEQKGYIKRTVYYVAGIYHEQLEKGKSYDTLKMTVSINVLAYDAFDHGDYHSEFVLYDKKHKKQLDDILEIHFFELRKIMKAPRTKKQKRQNMWLETIAANSEEEMQAVCDKYKDNYVAKCAEVVTAMNADTIFRERIRAHEDAVRERDSMLYDARQDGFAEGKAEALVNIMKNLKYNLIDSMGILNIPKSEYAVYTEIIRKNYPDVII